jgi:hypothetical protein
MLFDNNNKPFAKWKSSCRKELLQALLELEANDKPTPELHYHMRKAKDCLYYWDNDVNAWERNTIAIQIPSNIYEQQELDE